MQSAVQLGKIFPQRCEIPVQIMIKVDAGKKYSTWLPIMIKMLQYMQIKNAKKNIQYPIDALKQSGYY